MEKIIFFFVIFQLITNKKLDEKEDFRKIKLINKFFTSLTNEKNKYLVNFKVNIYKSIEKYLYDLIDKYFKENFDNNKMQNFSNILKVKIL